LKCCATKQSKSAASSSPSSDTTNSVQQPSSSSTDSSAQSLAVQACSDWENSRVGDPENPNNVLLKKLAQAALYDSRWSSMVKDFYIITDQNLQSDDPVLTAAAYDWMAQCRIARAQSPQLSNS